MRRVREAPTVRDPDYYASLARGVEVDYGTSALVFALLAIAAAIVELTVTIRHKAVR